MSGHNPETRFALIESLIKWQGSVNRSSLMSAFTISSAAAARVFKAYRELAGTNVKLDLSSQSYVANTDFSLIFAKGSMEEFLLFKQLIERGTKEEHNYKLSMLPQHCEPGISSCVHDSINRKKSISIVYSSLSSENHSERIIQPHTVIYATTRWHVRGYCYLRKDYRDFALSRISTADIVDKFSPNRTNKQDKNWNKFVNLVYRPNKNFSKFQQKAIARQYQMKNEQLEVQVRAPLIHYTIQEQRVALDLEKEPHLHLYLANKKEVEQYLFG